MFYWNTTLLLGSKPVTWSSGGEWGGRLMEGNRKQVGGKAIWFAYQFDKEGRRRMVDIFPASLAFHWEPRNSYTVCRRQWIIKVWDTKQNVGSLVQEILGGVPSLCGVLWTVEVTGQQNQLWVTWTNILSTPRLWFSWKIRSWTRGKQKLSSTLSSEGFWAHR